jgi:hypothetical protein
MINSFVHVIMYSYYFMSAFGPGVQKYLWWKRYLTQLQLVQFLLIIVHLINGMMQTDCAFPYVFNWYVIVYCVTLIALFTNFYIETYSHQRRDREAQALLAKETLLKSLNNNAPKKPMGLLLRLPNYKNNQLLTQRLVKTVLN